MVGAVPACRGGEAPPRRFSCSKIRTADDGSLYTDFQTAGQVVRLLLRSDIASLSAAFADREDRLVPVPEEIVDQVARHRAFRLDDILAQRPRLLVVSAFGAEGTSGQIPAAAYEDLAAYRKAKTGTIAVEIDVRGPLVAVLSTFEPVDWRVHVKGEIQLLAVHVEGLGAPTVTGVPQSVPLKVRSRAYGDSDTASPLSLPRDGDRSEHPRTLRDLARLRSFYAGASIALHSRRRLGTASLTDNTDFVAVAP